MLDLRTRLHRHILRCRRATLLSRITSAKGCLELLFAVSPDFGGPFGRGGTEEDGFSAFEL